VIKNNRLRKILVINIHLHSKFSPDAAKGEPDDFVIKTKTKRTYCCFFALRFNRYFYNSEYLVWR